jgi:hypothetical protein
MNWARRPEQGVGQDEHLVDIEHAQLLRVFDIIFRHHRHLRAHLMHNMGTNSSPAPEWVLIRPAPQHLDAGRI